MPTTVLYIHGLESGPQGRKARYLAEAGFTVVSERMPCGRTQILKDPAVVTMSALAVTLIVGGGARWGLTGLAVAASIVAVSGPFVASRLMRRVVRRSIEVQTRCLRAHPIDAVVGSSFGGAIALRLLAAGDWTGPTVLLCPAHQLVARRASQTAPTLPVTGSAHVVVVHGRKDETVPMANSEALVAGSRARLVLVDDDHRLSASATPGHLAEWVELAVRGPPTE